MHLATAEGIVENSSSRNVDEVAALIATRYMVCGSDMEGIGILILQTNFKGRAPGDATMKSLMLMEGIVPFEGSRITPKMWNEIPFNPKSGGCGASMRFLFCFNKRPIFKERCVLVYCILEPKIENSLYR